MKRGFKNKRDNVKARTTTATRKAIQGQRHKTKQTGKTKSYGWEPIE